MTNDSRAESLSRALDIICELQDTIAYAEATGIDSTSPEYILTKLERVRNLIDRSYPEDESDERYTELDFGEAQASFDFYETEEEHRSALDRDI
jgi:hypothetical protein